MASIAMPEHSAIKIIANYHHNALRCGLRTSMAYRSPPTGRKFDPIAKFA